jgi:hypothetical protein
MTAPSSGHSEDPPESAAEYRRVLDAILAAGGEVGRDQFHALGEGDAEALDEALRAFADEHEAASLPVLGALGSDRASRPLRRAAKRALFRLSQRGITPPAVPPRPVVARQRHRAARAWVSAVDGSGSRATWILIEGAYGDLSLCSIIVSDTIGVVEVAGGEISKRRLETELAALRADQKLPWVETDPGRAVGLVVEALELHRVNGTSPPAEFARWQPLFAAATAATAPEPPSDPDPALVDRSGSLLDLPEFQGWFLDPEAVQHDAVDLLEARESRLVVSDQIKAEREEAIIARVVDREFVTEARTRWARRLLEMALVFEAIGRADHAQLARAAAGALADPAREARHQPLVNGLVRRALDAAGEVALGRVKADEVSRKPGPVTAPRR